MLYWPCILKVESEKWCLHDLDRKKYHLFKVDNNKVERCSTVHNDFEPESGLKTLKKNIDN